MPKTFKAVIAALLIAIIGAASYNYFAFADERRVQRTLLDLGKKVSASATGGLNTVITAAAIKPLFAPEVTIFLQYDGELRLAIDRDELLRVIIGIKQNNPELKVKLDFSYRNVTITRNRRTATVSALTKIENFHETFEPRKLTFTFEKVETRWRLAAVAEGGAALKN